MSSDIKKTIVDKKLADYGLQEEQPLVIEDDIAKFKENNKMALMDEMDSIVKED